ncbi:MAG: tetraacyldisaccharide 4'-kinase [Spirochaetes bacterium]|nr:tetraacyldisaccharide 4'-kinase [Spirochaetota bacterium]
MYLYNIYKHFRLILLPFVPLYFIVFYIKRFISKPEKITIPVICIGNITTGGTGKTPTVIKVARLLQENGYSPGIISRGYRGSKSDKGAIVSDGSNVLLSHAEAGDEPFMIANELQNIPVVIGRKRRISIKRLISNFKVDTIIMDDGFQNNSIIKDISIINFDSTNPFGNSLLLPAGDLREPAFSLRRADFIIINKSDLITSKDYISLNFRLNRYSRHKQVYKARYKNEFLYRMNDTKKELPADFISGKNTLIISSIANPDSLKGSIHKLNPADIKLIPYPDHYSFSRNDIERIINESEKYDIAVITEKDFVKMSGYSFPDRFYVLKISLFIEDNDIFVDNLIERLQHIS